MRRKLLLVLALSIPLTFGALTAAPAMAAQSQVDVDAIATYEKLVPIVQAQVVKAYGTVETTVKSAVTSTVRGMIGDPAAIKKTAAPLIKDMLTAGLSQFNLQGTQIDPIVDSIIDTALDATFDSALLNSIMSNEFVQAVINRTIDNAVADIIAQLDIAGDIATQTTTLSDHIWNAPLRSAGTATTRVKGDIAPVCTLGGCVNGSYHSFNVTAWNTGLLGAKTTPKEIEVTGWNTTAINTYVSGAVGVTTVGNLGVYQAKLAKINYPAVLSKALVKAVQDEVKARIDAYILQGKTALTDLLTSELSKIGVTAQLDPTGSIQSIMQSVVCVLAGKGHTELVTLHNNLIARL